MAKDTLQNLEVQDEPIQMNPLKSGAYSAFSFMVGSEGGIVPSSQPFSVRFGGDGSDGKLEVLSGTFTIDLAGAQLVEKRYSSFFIAAGATLAFSNPHDNGTVFLPRVLGDSSILGTIDLSSLGGAGGAAGTTAGAGVGAPSGAGGASASTAGNAGQPGNTVGTPNPGTTGNGTFWVGSATGGGGGGITSAHAGGAASVSPLYLSSAAQYTRYLVIPGSGGGGGAGGASLGNGGAGGRGAGAMYMEVAGVLTFSGTITATGTVGSNAQTNGGGGGGGGGGSVVILAGKLGTNSGTISVTGGVGGTGHVTGGTGAAGFSVVAQNLYFI